MTGTRPSCSSRSICDKTSDAAPLMTRQSWGYPQSDMQIVDSRKRDEFCFSHTKFSDEDLEPGSTAADTGCCSQTHTQAKGHRRTRLSKKKKKFGFVGECLSDSSEGHPVQQLAAGKLSHSRYCCDGPVHVSNGDDKAETRPKHSNRNWLAQNERNWLVSRNSQREGICVESPRRSIGSRVKRSRWDDAVRFSVLLSWLCWWLCPVLDKSTQIREMTKSC